MLGTLREELPDRSAGPMHDEVLRTVLISVNHLRDVIFHMCNKIPRHCTTPTRDTITKRNASQQTPLPRYILLNSAARQTFRVSCTTSVNEATSGIPHALLHVVRRPTWRQQCLVPSSQNMPHAATPHVVIELVPSQDIGSATGQMKHTRSLTHTDF